MQWNIKLLFRSSLGGFEELGFHVDLAEFRDASAQLQQGLHAVENAHVCEPNLSDKFQLRMLREGRNGLRDSEHSANNVVGGISQCPIEH